MKSQRLRKLLMLTVLALALTLLALGATMKRKVYEPDSEATGLALFRRLADRQLVEDSTFGGVRRQNDKLYSTYDRDKPRGKIACPT
jgi:hypothetical protein